MPRPVQMEEDGGGTLRYPPLIYSKQLYFESLPLPEEFSIYLYGLLRINPVIPYIQ